MRIPESTRGRVIAGIVGVLVAAGVYMAYKTWFPEIDLQGLLNEFANFLGQWTYLVIGVLSFLETGAFVGLLVPGETALLVGGAVAGHDLVKNPQQVQVEGAEVGLKDGGGHGRRGFRAFASSPL